MSAATTATRCPACATAVRGSDRFCEVCGARLVERPGGDDLSADRRELDAGRVAAASDRGLVHVRNEDAFFVDAGDGLAVAVVCDGVSSAAVPHEASRAAADAAGGVLRVATDADDAVMLAAVAAASDAVAQVPWGSASDRAAPSCTVVAAVCTMGEALIASIGDSRAYWVDRDMIVQLTRDDSWAEEQVAAGFATPQQAASDPRAHMITHWLGADAPTDPPEIVRFAAPGAGRLVLCSDGLWNTADLDVLARMVRAHLPSTPPITVARALTDAAVRAGGRDNITVAVVDLLHDASDTPDPSETEESP